MRTGSFRHCLKTFCKRSLISRDATSFVKAATRFGGTLSSSVTLDSTYLNGSRRQKTATTSSRDASEEVSSKNDALRSQLPAAHTPKHQFGPPTVITTLHTGRAYPLQMITHRQHSSAWHLFSSLQHMPWSSADGANARRHCSRYTWSLPARADE